MTVLVDFEVEDGSFGGEVVVVEARGRAVRPGSSQDRVSRRVFDCGGWEDSRVSSLSLVASSLGLLAPVCSSLDACVIAS